MQDNSSALFQGMAALNASKNGVDGSAWNNWCNHPATTAEEIAAVRIAWDSACNVFAQMNLI